MTPEQMVYLVLAVGGAVGSAYWRFSTIISKVRDELAAHKLHTAETYVTKTGMQEQTQAIMKAIDSVAERLDGMNSRLDRVFEAKPVRRAS
ncbi:MAG: hypothetical protein E5Y51_23420 [Mesorhizobium sp.]|uniref:hypothetical protein n=1 Tax=Mesorhizobium sp. M1A.F.Ca.ET.072.01.1.1 TaxID=2496753 RepID=UPI000FD30D9E|nr:hypothetical protein [Mesorhizobium sp. M1A.F.Ca.ET.072.01.1.1]RUW52990.1 hypothetical protein EOA32_10935 [Mesorhizobium sp. M1A.F.Ca.ET.072.01.1.1]TIN14156.1 MAG: hypothetical protein E5Y51_23420 [Mesorhizobium sp.]TIV04356.1 MAG: hypothetical protein E5W04_04020 [Mesorhizobium sp.]